MGFHSSGKIQVFKKSHILVSAEGIKDRAGHENRLIPQKPSEPLAAPRGQMAGQAEEFGRGGIATNKTSSHRGTGR